MCAECNERGECCDDPPPPLPTPSPPTQNPQFSINTGHFGDLQCSTVNSMWYKKLNCVGAAPAAVAEGLVYVMLSGCETPFTETCDQ